MVNVLLFIALGLNALGAALLSSLSTKRLKIACNASSPILMPNVSTNITDNTGVQMDVIDLSKTLYKNKTNVQIKLYLPKKGSKRREIKIAHMRIKE